MGHVTAPDCTEEVHYKILDTASATAGGRGGFHVLVTFSVEPMS